MSLTDSVSQPFEVERRSHARCGFGGFAYVQFGSDNGAILIDLGEGGLGFQSVVRVSLDHVFLLKLKLRGVSIESYAEVTWLNESGKRGGLCFVELNAEARAQIRDLTSVVAEPEAVHPAEDGGNEGAAQQRWGLRDLLERESKWETRAHEALGMAVGVAAGLLLVLALVTLVPPLRTRVQATANPKSSNSILPKAQVFQVEVADLNNHRWTLRSGGEAASPFSGVALRGETQAAAVPASRSESAKASQSEDYETSSDVPDKPQLKLVRPGELDLSRPHALQAAVPAAPVAAPSIFDGITPPIGSASDSLVVPGPDAPRPEIVQPQSQPSTRRSTLQTAVLVQRVEPVYPKVARKSHLMGRVRLNVTIGRDGVPRDVKVLSGDPRLVDAALAAVKQWRYRPAMLGGEPVETQIIVNIDFELR